MKLKVSEIRKIIKEELGLNEGMPMSNTLKAGFTSMVSGFSNVVFNQILSQKLQKGNVNQRERNALGDASREYLNQVSSQFEADLQNLIEKHVSQAVAGYQAPTNMPKTMSQPPEEGPRHDQKKTVMLPPGMSD